MSARSNSKIQDLSSRLDSQKGQSKTKQNKNESVKKVARFDPESSNEEDEPPDSLNQIIEEDLESEELIKKIKPSTELEEDEIYLQSNYAKLEAPYYEAVQEESPGSDVFDLANPLNYEFILNILEEIKEELTVWLYDESEMISYFSKNKYLLTPAQAMLMKY